VALSKRLKGDKPFRDADSDDLLTFQLPSLSKSADASKGRPHPPGLDSEQAALRKPLPSDNAHSGRDLILLRELLEEKRAKEETDTSTLMLKQQQKMVSEMVSMQDYTYNLKRRIEQLIVTIAQQTQVIEEHTSGLRGSGSLYPPSTPGSASHSETPKGIPELPHYEPSPAGPATPSDGSSYRSDPNDTHPSPLKPDQIRHNLRRGSLTQTVHRLSGTLRNFASGAPVPPATCGRPDSHAFSSPAGLPTLPASPNLDMVSGGAAATRTGDEQGVPPRSFASSLAKRREFPLANPVLLPPTARAQAGAAKLRRERNTDDATQELHEELRKERERADALSIAIQQRDAHVHKNARKKHPQYPPRREVPDDLVEWSVAWASYDPIEFEHEVVHKNDRTVEPKGWADPPDPFRVPREEWQAPSGRKWKKLGPSRPLDGTELPHSAILAAALATKSELTEEEWAAFSISSTHLRRDHYVQIELAGDGGGEGTGSTHCYYKPAETRFSYEGSIVFEATGRPRNPRGRTGMSGRGLLGKWGPNHAADPIVTRWDPARGANLQMVAIKRKDTDEWAIPGGMVDAGETVSVTIKREFTEEAGNHITDPHRAQQFARLVDRLFSSGDLVYTGYVDDPRNTDNAWMETTAYHYHCSADLGAMMPLHAGDDAAAVMWLDIDVNNDMYKNLYASHREWVDQIKLKMDNVRVTKELEECG